MADGNIAAKRETILTQENFAASKVVLDKSIDRMGRLADDAYAASRECCGIDQLNARDQFAVVAAELRHAQAHMIMARSVAGGIEVGGRITRDGGT